MTPEYQAMLEFIGDRIRKAIEDSGLKKNVVAKRCGVSPQAITGWLNDGSIENT